MAVVLYTIIDEWTYFPKEKPLVRYTQLPKKERNRIRYQKRQPRLKDQCARARPTRPSDIAPPRWQDGINLLDMPAHKIPQPRAVTLGDLKAFASEFDVAWRRAEAANPVK